MVARGIVWVAATLLCAALLAVIAPWIMLGDEFSSTTADDADMVAGEDAPRSIAPAATHVAPSSAAPTAFTPRLNTTQSRDAHYATAFQQLESRGFAFVDRYPDATYLATGRYFKPNWPEQLSRAISGDPGRERVNFVWTPHGFGSNMINHVNYIIYAALNNATLTLVSKGSPYLPDRPVIEYKDIPWNYSLPPHDIRKHLRWWANHQSRQNVLQAWFDEFMAYSVPNDTTAERYNELCYAKRDCDFPPFGVLYRNGSADMYKGAKYFVQGFRRHEADFCSSRMTVTRALMRLKPAARAELDALVRPLTRDVNMSDAVAVHVRRGDKVGTGEARPTHVSHYVNATVFAARRGNASVVFVLSDADGIGAEFAAHWKAVGASNDTVIVFRRAANRPDKRSDPAQSRLGFLWLLVDLRLVVEAGTFVGTQSSTLGVLAAALRGWNRCFNAENGTGYKASTPYEWLARKDKPARL